MCKVAALVHRWHFIAHPRSQARLAQPRPIQAGGGMLTGNRGGGGGGAGEGGRQNPESPFFPLPPPPPPPPPPPATLLLSRTPATATIRPRWNVCRNPPAR